MTPIQLYPAPNDQKFIKLLVTWWGGGSGGLVMLPEIPVHNCSSNVITILLPYRRQLAIELLMLDTISHGNIYHNGKG